MSSWKRLDVTLPGVCAVHRGLNDGDIILLPYSFRFNNKKKKMYTYNISTRIVTKHKIRDCNINNVDITAIDRNNKCLYIVHSYQNLSKIDISNKSFGSNLLCKHSEFPLGKAGIVINEQFHIFGQDSHLIWNHQKKQFIKNKSHKKDSIAVNTDCSGIILISNPKRMLVLGGIKNGNSTNDIYSYNIDNKQWIHCKWSLPIPLRVFGCIITTKDELYVITFGGCPATGIGRIDDIYILNTKTMKFIKSNIDCPNKDVYHAMIPTNDKMEELSVFGYIRTIWRSDKFDDLLYPPYYLIQIIKQFYNNEYVYLIGERDSNHWKIKVDALIH